MILSNISWYISGALLVFLLATGIYSAAVIGNLEEEIVALKVSNALTVVQHNTLKDTLTKNNKRIQRLSTTLTAKQAALEEWKNKPPHIKYRTIYKELPDIDLRKDDCETLKNVVDIARRISNTGQL